MPNRPPHECNKPGCHRLTTERFCAEHSRKDRQRVDARRGTATQRGYGANWRRLRNWYIKTHPLCATCEAKGRLVAATDVDHIVPRSKGGEDDEDNLQSLCRHCHSTKTASADGGFGNRT